MHFSPSISEENSLVWEIWVTGHMLTPTKQRLPQDRTYSLPYNNEQRDPGEWPSLGMEGQTASWGRGAMRSHLVIEALV